MEIEKILPFVLVPLFVAALALICYLGLRAEKQRREALRQLAGDLGLEFEAQPHELLTAEFARLHLFTRGHSRRTYNLLRDRKTREETLLFDYTYVISSGKNRSTRRQTVAAFSLGARILPGFELRPESVFHKIGAAFGYQDIDFPDYPDFSARYLVRGKDESAVRDLFDGTLIEAVGNVPDICVEGDGPWLVIYRDRRRLNAAQVPEFLDAARALRSAFARRCEARRA
jgi:hypothetical protein